MTKFDDHVREFKYNQCIAVIWQGCKDNRSYMYMCNIDKIPG